MMPAGDPNGTAEDVMLDALKGCALAAVVIVLGIGALIGAVIL